MTSEEAQNLAIDGSVEPKTHIFGDESISDVTLVVGEEEFKCHKMMLAARSSYFRALFFSNFMEKNQDKISIVADPAAFFRLMQMMYTASYGSWQQLLYCAPKSQCVICNPNDKNIGSCKECMPISFVWHSHVTLLKLADQYDVLQYAVDVLDNFFVRSCCLCREGDNCPRSAVKLLIAVTYRLATVKVRSKSTRNAVMAALEEVKKVDPVDRIFNADDLLWLMKRD